MNPRAVVEPARGDGRDDLVRIRVRRCAGAGLIDVDREVSVVGTIGDLGGGDGDGAGGVSAYSKHFLCFLHFWLDELWRRSEAVGSMPVAIALLAPLLAPSTHQRASGLAATRGLANARSEPLSRPKIPVVWVKA